MTSQNYFLSYIDKCGGRVKASAALGVPYSTISSICNGYRGVSRDMADRMSRITSGELDANVLVWIKASKVEARQKIATS